MGETTGRPNDLRLSTPAHQPATWVSVEICEIAGRLFKLHSDDMRRAALSVLGDAAQAEDVVQNVFMRLMSGTALVNASRPGRRYLLRAARNEAISAIRRARSMRLFSDEIAESIPDSRPTPEQEVERTEQHRLLRAEMEKLPLRCRTVASLVIWKGLTHREVATQLGISRKAVEKQMSRAYRLLAQHVSSRLRANESMTSKVDGGGGE